MYGKGLVIEKIIKYISLNKWFWYEGKWRENRNMVTVANKSIELLINICFVIQVKWTWELLILEYYEEKSSVWVYGVVC